MEKQVAEHGHGPLFRHLSKDKNGKRSTYVARKIDDWMDGVIKDPNLAPNHSFRHYLKSELLARDKNDYLRAIRRHQRRGGDSSRSAVVVSGVGCCGRAAPLRSCMEMGGRFFVA